MIFYCESRIFSGQERMFLTAACALSLDTKCILIVNRMNASAIEFSKKNGNFSEINLLDNFDQRFSSLLVWFRWNRISSLSLFLKKNRLQHSTICVSQGRIESGNVGVIAGKLARLNVISYIPMVHSHVEMGSGKFSGAMKGLLCSILYKLPDSFITISNEVAIELRGNCKAEIKVVENFAQQRDLEHIKEPPALLDDKEYYKLILPGRLLNKQKGQLDLVKALKIVSEKTSQKIVCYIVGDGPDKDLINTEIYKLCLNQNIFMLGNRSDLLSIMYECDLVVLPSIFEGVPLVLLEAAILGKDIIASDIIGFKEYLSGNDVFSPSNPDSLADKIISKLQKPTIRAVYSKSLQYLISRNEKLFTDDFRKALSALSSGLFIEENK